MGRLVPLPTASQPDSAARLIPFTIATKPNYRAAAMHWAIAQHLERVERGEIDRLLIETPPRHGKSELVSVRFPAWYIGRHPDRHVIAASHTLRLARSFGRRARNLVDSEQYAAMFPAAELARDSFAADEWHLKGRDGGYLAAGIGGPITGSGADVAIIDDPVKNRTQVDSPTYRDQIWEWYNDVLLTRLEGRGAIVLTMTRWHRDDLAGRVLEDDPLGWTVLRLPAIAELDDPLGRAPGEALWPEKYPLPALERIQATDVDFDALYQQNPTARGGSTFDRAWVEGLRYDASDRAYVNRAVGRWISWDTALKDKSTSDYSAATVFELMPDYRVVVRDVFRARMQFPDLPATIEEMARRYNRDEKLRGIVIEDRVSGTSAYQTLMHTAPSWIRPLLFAYSPQGGKEYRAQQASVWVQNGSVLMPYPSDDARWLSDFESELFGFPSVQHDDQVDSFVQGILFLENLLSAGLELRMEAVTNGA